MNTIEDFETRIRNLIEKMDETIDEEKIIEDMLHFRNDIYDRKKYCELKELTRNIPDDKVSYNKIYNEFIFKICLKQYLKILKIFYKSNIRFFIPIQTIKEIDIFEYGCDNNLLEIVKWSWSEIKNTIFNRFEYYELYDSSGCFIPFYNVCAMGYLEIAKFLFEQFKNEYSIVGKSVLKGYKIACKNNKIHIMEWILTLEFSMIIPTENERLIIQQNATILSIISNLNEEKEESEDY